MQTIEILNIIGMIIIGILILIFLINLVKAICIVPQKRAYIVERLGKYSRTLGAGFHPLVPFFEKVAFIQDLKEEVITVPPQLCFTQDNVRVEVDGVIYISVVDPVNASYGITNYRDAAIQLAQTTTRSVIGTIDLDKTFEERDLINLKALKVLSEVSTSWGIKVHRYEVKNIVPPETIKNSMERLVTAERQKRAIIAKSEGDRQSRINKSEGLKIEMINKSEGEMQRRINEAEGKASEIEALAQATAESIEKLADAISVDGGEEAIKLRLSQEYLNKLSLLASEKTKVILPADLSQIKGLLQSIGIDL